MILIFFVVVPLFLIALFIFANMYPEYSRFFGNAGTLVTFITALFTYIYVVLTGFMVRQTIKNAEEERRPFVVADFELEGSIFNFVLKNIGKLPAKNVSVSITPDIELDKDKSFNSSIFNKPISLMPPGKEIKSFIDVGHQMLKDDRPHVFQVDLEYEWGNSNSADESYTFDISIYKYMPHIIRYTEHDIYKQIKEINKNFKKVIKTNGIHIKTSSDLKREQEEMLKRVKENESR